MEDKQFKLDLGEFIENCTEIIYILSTFLKEKPTGEIIFSLSTMISNTIKDLSEQRKEEIILYILKILRIDHGK